MLTDPKRTPHKTAAPNSLADPGDDALLAVLPAIAVLQLAFPETAPPPASESDTRFSSTRFSQSVEYFFLQFEGKRVCHT